MATIKEIESNFRDLEDRYVDNRPVMAEIGLRHEIRQFVIEKLKMLGSYYSNAELESDVDDIVAVVLSRSEIAAQNEPF